MKLGNIKPFTHKPQLGLEDCNVSILIEKKMKATLRCAFLHRKNNDYQHG